MPFNHSLFSATLKHWRGERGLREVATLIGISASTLSRIENEHPPDIETFAAICEKIGVDPAVFFKTPPEMDALKELEAKQRELEAEYERQKQALWAQVMGTK